MLAQPPFILGSAKSIPERDEEPPKVITLSEKK
jgi:hypothetical protein